MSRGSVRQSLSFKDLGLMFLPLPPVEEQKAIAYVLSAVQEAREKTEKVTEATKRAKKVTHETPLHIRACEFGRSKPHQFEGNRNWRDPSRLGSSKAGRSGSTDEGRRNSAHSC